MSEGVVVSVGWSSRSDAYAAGRDAARTALAKAPVGVPRVAFVFGSSWLHQQLLLQGVRSVLGPTPIAGGSTAGEITPEGPCSHTGVVCLLAAEGLCGSIGAAEPSGQAPREMGQQAAYQAVKALSGGPRVGYVLFVDGLTTSAADIVRGIQEVLGIGTLIVGGMTGDDLRFARTFQYANTRVVTGGVVGMLVAGGIKMGIGMGHGFAPISKPRQVTRATANVIFELDDKPAAAVYEEYFGDRLTAAIRGEPLTRQALAYPLGIQCEESTQWLLRNVVSFHDDGSLVCNAEIPPDSWVQLMISSRQLALEAARQAALGALQPLRQVAGALVFDCVSRKTLLGEWNAAQEIAAIRQILGPAVPIAGGYTYGEQGPIGTASSVYGRTSIQTGSVLVVAFGT